MIGSIIKKTRDFKYFYIIFYLLNLFLLLFFCFLTYIFYIDLKSKNPIDYCYAIFVANSIICNSLFALGRSNIFIEIYQERIIQKQIYGAANRFLAAAIVSLLAAIFGYIFTVILADISSTDSLQLFNTIPSTLLAISFLFIQSGLGRLKKFMELRQQMQRLKNRFPKSGDVDFIEKRHGRPFRLGEKHRDFYDSEN